MATGDVKKGGNSGSVGSEDLCEVVCDPCQEDGALHTAVGMCVDCQDHLCQRCFDGHKIGRAYRKHELLNKDDMLRSQVFTRKDKCTEKCDVHEDEVIKYYCKDHCQLGCSVCITIHHRACENVTYIPHAAKDIDNNEEYKHAEKYLNSVAERYEKLTDDYMQKIKSLEINFNETVDMIHEFRLEINETLNKIEADLIRKCEELKTVAINKMSRTDDKFKKAQTDVRTLMTTKETHRNKNQICNLYTLMMKSKDTLKNAEDRIQQVEKVQSSINCRIQFTSNEETVDKLKQPEAFGTLLSGTSIAKVHEEEHIAKQQLKTTATGERRKYGAVIRAEYIRDVHVKFNNDKRTSYITGLTALPDNRLLIIDSSWFWFEGNGSVKLVNVEHDKVITHLELSSSPFDVTLINNSQAAVTVPNDEKVVTVNVTTTTMTVDRMLDVDGQCWGVDYKDGKLAVSFINPDKVQVITLHGRVLHTISYDKQGLSLFRSPAYVVFDRDSRSLWVSNNGSNKVIHVNFDETVAGICTDRELRGPHALLTTSSGSVYVCGYSSDNMHQITEDSGNIRELLNREDGLYKPCSIGSSETEDMIYVGMWNNNVVKVYKVCHQ